MSLRKLGSGIAVCQGWVARPEMGTSHDSPAHAPLEDFRLQTRDPYLPVNDIGLWSTRPAPRPR